jgi:hypothetical protein
MRGHAAILLKPGLELGQQRRDAAAFGLVGSAARVAERVMSLGKFRDRA